MPPLPPPTPDLDTQLAYMLEDDLGKDYETYLSDQPPSRAKAIKVTRTAEILYSCCLQRCGS